MKSLCKIIRNFSSKIVLKMEMQLLNSSEHGGLVNLEIMQNFIDIVQLILEAKRKKSFRKFHPPRGVG